LADMILATPSVAFVQECRAAVGEVDADQVRHLWIPDGVSVVEFEVSIDAAIAEANPALVAIGPGVRTVDAVQVAAHVEREHPMVTVVLFDEATPEVWRAAARAGIRDVIDPRQTRESLRVPLRQALTTARDRRGVLSGASDADLGRLITVISPKGGSGKTMLSTSVAVAMAEHGSVALVDLDLQFGDTPTALGLVPEYSIFDVAGSARDLDATTVKVFMTAHPSGIFVLTAPQNPADGERISLDLVKRVLEVLRRSFDYVIVDTGAGVDEFALAAIERSTDLLALCSMDVASATSLKKELMILDRLEMTGSARHFVLNRVDARVSLTVEEIEELIGLPVAARIPNTSNVTRAMNVGRPFLASSPRAPESRAVRAFVRDQARTGQGDGVVDDGRSRGGRGRKRMARR